LIPRQTYPREGKKMIDVLLLAKEAVTFLAPFLPYLIKSGGTVAEEAGKKLGEQAGAGAWEQAKTLWSKLWPKVEAKPAARAALEELVANPKDEDTRGALRLQLRKLFTEDEALAQDVFKIQNDVKQSGVNVAAIGERSVAIGGPVSNTTIITGDNNKP
jgi:hypothetical protein